MKASELIKAIQHINDNYGDGKDLNVELLISIGDRYELVRVPLSGVTLGENKIIMITSYCRD